MHSMQNTKTVRTLVAANFHARVSLLLQAFTRIRAIKTEGGWVVDPHDVSLLMERMLRGRNEFDAITFASHIQRI